MKKSIERQNWRDFKTTGMLWFANRMLHVFGWCIVFELDDAGLITEVYPARTKFRGFNSEADDAGFTNVTVFMEQHAAELLEDLR